MERRGGRVGATGWHVKDTKTIESFLSTSRANSPGASVGASCLDGVHA